MDSTIRTFIRRFNADFDEKVKTYVDGDLLIVVTNPTLIHKSAGVNFPKELENKLNSTTTSPVLGANQNMCLINAILQQLNPEDKTRLDKWRLTPVELKKIALMCEGETDINAMTGSENFFIILASILSATIIIYDHDNNQQVQISPVKYVGQALTMVFNLHYAHYTAIPLYNGNTDRSTPQHDDEKLAAELAASEVANAAQCVADAELAAKLATELSW